MKKNIVPIMNTVLVLLVVAAIGFTVYNGLFRNRQQTPIPEQGTTNPTAAPTDTDATVSSQLFKIGIVQHSDDPTSQRCYDGFLKGFQARGVLNSLAFDYVNESDEKKCLSEIERLSKTDCDLILTIGPFASENAAKVIKDKPIIFSDVTEPEQLGLVKSNETPGGNVTGVSSYTPCFEQIDLIPLLLPEAKKVGSIYCHTDASAVTQALVAEKEATSDKVGLEFESFPIIEKKDLSDALASVAESDVDVLYLPTDEMVYKNIKTIIKFTDEQGIPVICADEQTLKAGAFATSIINFESVGIKSADLAYAVLFDKKDTATLPVIYTYECFSYVNQDAMNTLEISVPGEALNIVELKRYSR